MLVHLSAEACSLQHVGDWSAAYGKHGVTNLQCTTCRVEKDDLQWHVDVAVAPLCACHLIPMTAGLVQLTHVFVPTFRLFYDLVCRLKPLLDADIDLMEESDAQSEELAEEADAQLNGLPGSKQQPAAVDRQGGATVSASGGSEGLQQTQLPPQQQAAAAKRKRAAKHKRGYDPDEAYVMRNILEIDVSVSAPRDTRGRLLHSLQEGEAELMFCIDWEPT